MVSSLVLLAASAGMGNAAIVDKIEPPCWWVGMQNDTLQLMVSGKDVAEAQVNAAYPGVQLIESVAGDS